MTRIAAALAVVGMVFYGPSSNVDASPSTSGDFAGLVGIGGQSLYPDKPELVIDAIAQVVAAVRDPSTWAR